MKLIDNAKAWLGSKLTREQTYKVIRTRYARADEVDEDQVKAAITNWQDGRLATLYAVFSKMLQTDPHLASVVQTRKLAIINTPFGFVNDNLEPDDPKFDFLSKHIRPLVRQWAGALFNGLIKGAYIGDMKWELGDNWIPGKLNDAPMEAYRWQDGEFWLLSQSENRFNAAETHSKLNPYTQITFTPNLMDGLPYGIMQACINFWLYKQFTSNNWASFTEIYGMPARLGKYKPGTSLEDQAQLWSMVASMGTDAAAVISSDTVIEFLETRYSAYGKDIYDGLIELANAEYSKAILGQTSSADTVERGNYYSSKNHAQIREDYRIADIMLIEEAINELLISAIIQFNFPISDIDQIPRLKFNTERILDAKTFSNILESVYRMGGRVHQEDLIRAGVTVKEGDPEFLQKAGGSAIDFLSQG